METNESRIMVVDDDVPIRQFLVGLLTDAGYTVIEATHGVHALQVLTTTPVDLVISDVMMPLLDGVGLCRQVKATGQAAVILMSSAPWQESFAAGEDAFIAKPFDIDNLEELIATVLASRQSAPDHDRVT